MQTQFPPADPALAMARQRLGGDIALSLKAARVSGLPFRSRVGLSLARKQGRVPFRETRIGQRYYCRACDYADAFLRSETPDQAAVAVTATEQPKKNKGGRPRKQAPPPTGDEVVS